MSFVRLKPEDVFPRTRQLLDELSAVVERAERLVPLPTLADGLQQVRAFGETPSLQVALCLATPLDPAALLTVLRWLAPGMTMGPDIATQVATLPTSLSTQMVGWDITVRLFTWDQPPRYRVGAVRAPLLLILGDAATLTDERALVALKALCGNHPYVMLVSLPGEPLAPACVEALRHETWELETHVLDALPDTALLERVLTSPIVDILRAHVLLRAGRALAEAVKAHLDEEHNSLKDLQAVLQTRLQNLQQAELRVLPRLQNQLRDWVNLCRNAREACTTLLHVTPREEVWPAYESRLPAVTVLDQTPREENWKRACLSMSWMKCSGSCGACSGRKCWPTCAPYGPFTSRSRTRYRRPYKKQGRLPLSHCRRLFWRATLMRCWQGVCDLSVSKCTRGNYASYNGKITSSGPVIFLRAELWWGPR